eukprot:984785-Pyramimonas_sp.AAC.1
MFPAVARLTVYRRFPFSETRFFAAVAGYVASACQILRSAGAVLLSKHLEEPTLIKQKSKLSSRVLTIALQEKSSTRFLAVARLAVYRRFPVGWPDQKRECGNLGS